MPELKELPDCGKRYVRQINEPKLSECFWNCQVFKNILLINERIDYRRLFSGNAIHVMWMVALNGSTFLHLFKILFLIFSSYTITKLPYTLVIPMLSMVRFGDRTVRK